jgi:16S rRNA C967 or C1407 C5-methylase (RsmB/RsmF family)
LLEECVVSSSNASSFRILDLCCAPGQKLLALADGLSHNRTTTIVGVDVSVDRLAVCQKALRKYYASPNTVVVSRDGQPRIRVYCADGTTFGAHGTDDRDKLMWDSTVAQQDTASSRKRLNKSARARQRKQLLAVVNLDWDKATTADAASEVGSQPPCIESFHAVLVDAECSTDGSIKHVQKRRRLEWTTERLPALVALQRQLAASGFRLLKQGGTLVYATCSLSTDQNEGVVEWLLQEFKSQARLIAVTFPEAPPSVRAGSLPGTLRFWPSEDPEELMGGGFFIAKIRKE